MLQAKSAAVDPTTNGWTADGNTEPKRSNTEPTSKSIARAAVKRAISVSDMIHLAGNHFHEAFSEVADEVSFLQGHHGGFLDMSNRGKQARWSVDWFPGTYPGQFTTLLGIACVMVLCSTWVWEGVKGDEALAGDEYSRLNGKWRVSAWHAWSLFIDPGTQTGIAGTSLFAVKCMGAIISIFGFIFNLTVLGFIVDFMRNLMERLGKLYGRDVCNDHSRLRLLPTRAIDPCHPNTALASLAQQFSCSAGRTSRCFFFRS